MAVYSRLLLSTGGGIISSMQQAGQVKNTATLLIGLGGTGIDSLRTIKTKVYSRLRPDGPNTVTPRYEHIRFLGIDSDISSRSEQNRAFNAGTLMALDDLEYFSITSPNIGRILNNPKILEMRDELSWLCWEDIDARGVSSSGVRQIGRFMMMEYSSAFMDRVEREIIATKAGLKNPAVHVHIFSGLGGGTGSGCFLDVCYMVRHLAKKMVNVKIFGYFFLPDVNLSVVPPSCSSVRANISANGYAAMQELDYCMGLPLNGGGFTQDYQDHIAVDWKEPPVDMCHLVCGINARGEMIKNAYDYAMNVTAEYILDMLADSRGGRSIDEECAAFHAIVNMADQGKTIGANLAYCVTGAACAYIPLREINTYLASELFAKFARIDSSVPTRDDAEELAISALAPCARSLSDALYRELCRGADNSYTPYAKDWKYVRDHGSSEMIACFTSQTAVKLSNIIKNGQSMTSASNEQSLINRVRAQLDKVIRDINRGPVFASLLISGAQNHNLLNIIDGLLRENRSRRAQEAEQVELRLENYNAAKSDFDNRRQRMLFGSNQKRFSDYENSLTLLEQHKLALSCCRELDGVLQTLRRQLVNSNAGYYVKLSNVMNRLIRTFKENHDVLANEKNMQPEDTFAVPMITIAELKKTLDAEVERANASGMLYQFMDLFLDNEDTWLDEDENKIVELVNTFFVKTAFNGFANRTIAHLLKDKYGIDNDGQLAHMIYSDWISQLTGKASPLFYFNSGVWPEDQTGQQAFLSFPGSSAPIEAAVRQMHAVDHAWQMKESALTDRILAMRKSYALPLNAYRNCAEYETIYFRTSNPGRHIYEGNPVPGMPFNDWRKLPPLTGILRLEEAPEPVREFVRAAQALYTRACQAGIFDGKSRVCAPDPIRVEDIRALVREAEEMAAHPVTPSDPAALREMLERLQAARDIPMIATEHRMKNDGCDTEHEIKLRVQKDYFVSSPAYHDLVRDILQQIDELNTAIDHAVSAIRCRIEHGNS